MSPRRYRVALLAYPEPFRRAHGDAMVGTLLDGDEERGRSSLREALRLAAHGAAMRLHPRYATPLLVMVGLLLIVAALLPDGWWAHAPNASMPVAMRTDAVYGPGDPERLALAVVGLVAMAVGRPRAAVGLALVLPYASLVSGDLAMGYGRSALVPVAADETILVVGAGVGLAVAAHLVGRLLRVARPGVGAAGLAAGCLLTAVGAVRSVVGHVQGALGSSATEIPTGPRIVGPYGPGFVLCVAVGTLAGLVLLRVRLGREAVAA